MKKNFILMILAFGLVFSGCGKQEAEVENMSGATQETEKVTTPSATQETEEVTTPSTTQETSEPGTEYEVPESAAANAEIDYYSAYKSVFEDYEKILSGEWDAENLLNNDFPQQLIYCMGDTPYDNIGYTLVDLDNNGIQELLIGEASDDPFYDCLLFQMYTLENGNVIKVLSSQENAGYQLCEDSTIALNYTDDSDDAGVSHYVYNNGTLDEVDSDSPAQELCCTPFSFYEQYIK